MIKNVKIFTQRIGFELIVLFVCFCVFMALSPFGFLLAKIGDEGAVVNDKKQAHAPAFL